jgi:hypothetical protein
MFEVGKGAAAGIRLMLARNNLDDAQKMLKQPASP